MRQFLLYLPRSWKRLILVANDLVLVELCLLLAFHLRLDWPPRELIASYLPVFLLTPLCVLGMFWRLELYSSITRHAGPEIIGVFARGLTIAVLMLLVIFLVFPTQPQMPRSVLGMFWALAILALLTSRLVASRWFHGSSLSSMLMDFAGWRPGQKQRGRAVAIYGAGEAGRQLVGALGQGRQFRPVAFVDDDPTLQGQWVVGIKVYAPWDLRDLIDTMGISELMLAIPSASRRRRQEIIHFLESLDIHVVSVPAMEELAQGLVTVEDIREVDVADILGRDPVFGDPELLAASITGRSLLVTGAGGSIGAELCRRIIRHRPSRLVLLDHSEYNLYAILSELDQIAGRARITVELLPVLGSVTDGALCRAICRKHRIHSIYHAAAYKHVPLVEHNGYQGFVNNVWGTLVLAQAAMEAGVASFVLISTDKAVRSTNIMGVTKRLAELVLQALSGEKEVDFDGLPPPIDSGVVSQGTRFTMVRFGNVLDSSGSVIPRFRAQIRAGGPVTVTHRDVTRYFMTIPEAAELVLQANALSSGGDVFLLDMGEPVKIDDLARRLIHLSGLSVRDADHPDGDIEIRYTGIRPGEKLFEELLLDDAAQPTSHPKVWRANEQVIPWGELKKLLVEVHDALALGDDSLVEQLLARPEVAYKPVQLVPQGGLPPSAFANGLKGR
ncbi:MAG TPA: nucleoside-diphosphate sugar epimerase/dehydratase [Porticoccaceae bacterium]